MYRAKGHKPHLLKIQPPLENSFVIKGDDISWTNPWHFHPEIELLYCIKGKGTNYIGSSIRPIEEGELLLFGKNLPHTRQRDKEYYMRNPDDAPESIVIQFKEDFLGEQFFTLKEFIHVHNLLKNAQRGMKFSGQAKQDVVEKLYALRSERGASAVIELLSILNILGSSLEFEYLNSEANSSSNSDATGINLIYNFVSKNFKEQIALEDVAALTDHSMSGFCRFFKRHTRKSFSQYLTEVRVEYACHLLMEGTLNVSEVCFESGFNNFSNFHKQFRKIVKMAPSEYKTKSKNKVAG